jgi:hypothetical protein
MVKRLFPKVLFGAAALAAGWIGGEPSAYRSVSAPEASHVRGAQCVKAYAYTWCSFFCCYLYGVNYTTFSTSGPYASNAPCAYGSCCGTGIVGYGSCTGS